MSIGKELLDRLICAKYIFLKGIDLLNRGGHFSSGLAVLYFQDATEMVLRVIAEHLHCPLKDSSAFNQIIEEINKSSDIKLTHCSALNQLNKARVNFKHYGLEPKAEDVNKFRCDLEAFFPSALHSFLNIDFESISLANLIGHRRTENFLNYAERFIDEGNYERAINATAIAFAIFCRHFPIDFEEFQTNRFISSEEYPRWVENIIEDIDQLKSQLNDLVNFIAVGINISDYLKFQRYIPNINLSIAGTFEPIGKHTQPKPTQGIALFCYHFVIDAILLVKDNRLPPRFPLEEPKKRYRVIKKSEVILWPCENPEIIWQAEVDEILYSREQNSIRNDYVPIVQDVNSQCNDAYIKKEAVVSCEEEH